MTPNLNTARLPLETRSDTTTLDIVVPFTTRPLTRAALTTAGKSSSGLAPLIRMVHTQVVPFPLQLDDAPISTAVLRRQLAPLAEEFGAHLQICFTRDAGEGLLHVLSADSLIVLAARKSWWRPRWWKSPQERLAKRLTRRGYNVLLEIVENTNA
jgi:hypothetical protein